MICSMKSSGCRGRVSEWRVWRAGDFEATGVSLCSTHAKCLTQLLVVGVPEVLPPRPRVELRATKLKPVAATKHLKKPRK